MDSKTWNKLICKVIKLNCKNVWTSGNVGLCFLFYGELASWTSMNFFTVLFHSNNTVLLLEISIFILNYVLKNYK